MNTNKTRQKLEPHQALKMVANTLNCHSLTRERVRMDRVDEATSEILTNWKPRRIIVNSRDVVLSGIEGVLAVIRSWKPADFDIVRVRGKRKTVHNPNKQVKDTIKQEIERQMARFRT